MTLRWLSFLRESRMGILRLVMFKRNVVLPHEDFQTLRALIIFWCQALAFANPKFFGDYISKKYENPKRRRLFQSDNETPLPGGR